MLKSQDTIQFLLFFFLNIFIIMKHVFYFFFTISLLLILSCKNESNNSSSSNFSPLIEFQYPFIVTNVENGTIIETYEIKYRSDGFMITGYISKPKDGEYPAIIYNRGGNKDFGTHSLGSIELQRSLASRGFVVLSTQLRGNIFSQGRDEFGGKDLNDILALIEIAKDLNFVQPKKIGVYGISRGGMNTYQISRLTDDIEAIAVVGAPVNPRFSHPHRPRMYTHVHLPIFGDTIKYKSEYDYRSPILWVDEINEPVLVMHGEDDNRVLINGAKMMVDSLKAKNKEMEYQFFENGNHGLSTHAVEKEDKLVAWFSKYLK